MTPKYGRGQLIYFEIEYMTAVLLPNGHTEMSEYLGFNGVITGINMFGEEYNYSVESEDDLPDGFDGNRIEIVENEIIEATYVGSSLDAQLEELMEV